MNKIKEREQREARKGMLYQEGNGYARTGMALKKRIKREDRFYVQEKFSENECHAAS